MLHWKALTSLSDEQLGALDVAEVNLACAAGFPDSGDLKIAECIARLNHYSKCVGHYTEKRMPEFRNRPEEHDGSGGRFRIMCLLTLLQQQYGVRYNPAKTALDAPLDTADVFIHGALTGAGGTCASLPVIYTAVGRRLGYPLKLVSTRTHLFCRWDDPHGERFNIEVNNVSWDTLPDDHYRQGRFVMNEEVERMSCYLQSKTPREELSEFLTQRGHRWLDYRNYREVLPSFIWACALNPANIRLMDVVNELILQWD